VFPRLYALIGLKPTHPSRPTFVMSRQPVDNIVWQPVHSALGKLPRRPRCRRREAFTTDAKIIRLTRRRVAFFLTAEARQFFDGDYDATYT